MILMIEAYLLNLNIKDDLAYLANQTNEDFLYYENMKKDKFSSIEMEVIKRSRFIYDNNDEYKKKLEENKCMDLYENIEMPLVKVLADMELLV